MQQRRGRMKKLFYVTDKEGKEILSIVRTAIGIGATVLIGAMITWFSWVTTQAYDVATNKKLIADTGVRLEKSINEINYDFKNLEESVKKSLERTNTILHSRITNVDNKYDKKLTEIQRMIINQNTLIVEILMQQHKEVELRKKEVQIQKEQLTIQQRSPTK